MIRKLYPKKLQNLFAASCLPGRKNKPVDFKLGHYRIIGFLYHGSIMWYFNFPLGP